MAYTTKLKYGEALSIGNALLVIRGNAGKDLVVVDIIAPDSVKISKTFSQEGDDNDNDESNT